MKILDLHQLFFWRNPFRQVDFNSHLNSLYRLIDIFNHAAEVMLPFLRISLCA